MTRVCYLLFLQDASVRVQDRSPEPAKISGEKSWGMENGNKQIKTTQLHRSTHVERIF